MKRNDLALYESHAKSFWDENDRFFRSLRSVGRFHLGLIDREWGQSLPGARVADLGCGGGRLAIALAERGALVTGVDRSAPALDAGRDEARRRACNVRFLEGDLFHTGLASEDFDFVILGDVLEHVEPPSAAIAEAARLLAPRGRLFVNTFDRTRLASLAVVHVAEGLGLVPRGTHDPAMFVRPAELEDFAAKVGVCVDRIVWERPKWLASLRSWTIHLTEAKSGLGYSAFLSRVAS